MLNTFEQGKKLNIKRWWVNQFGGSYHDEDTLVWVIEGTNPLVRLWAWTKHRTGHCHAGCSWCYDWAMKEMEGMKFTWNPENDTGPTDPHRRTIWLRARQGGKTKK